MRKGTVCVTCEQLPEAFDVLTDRSRILSAPLEVVSADPISSLMKALPTVAHRTNTAIAIRVASHVLQGRHARQSYRAFDEQDISKGLETCKSPGSFQEISKPPCHFFLDSAHNALSIPVALEWFAERVASLDQQ